MNLCEIEKKTVAWQTFKDGDGEIYLFDNEGILCAIDPLLNDICQLENIGREFIQRTDFELCQ